MSPRLAVNICFFINGFIFANWAARLPRLQEDYGMDNKALGFVLLAHSIGAFIAMPISGWLIVKNGSRMVTIISAVLFCVFFILIPQAPTYGTLLLPFFFMGASTGVMDVAMNAQAVVVERDLRKPVMTFFHGMFSIGMVAGGLSGSFFTGIQWALNPHFILAGTASLLVLAAGLFFLHPDAQSKQSEAGKAFLLPRGGIVLLGVIAFCCMLGEGAMADWSANYLKNAMNASEVVAAMGLTAFAAFMTVGRLVGDRGRVIYGDKRLLQVCSVISMAGILIILGKWTVISSIAGFGLVGLGLSIVVPVVYSLAGSFPGLSPGVGIAMSTTIGYAGFMIGPPIMGFIADASDIRMAMFFIAALFILMTFLVFRIPPSGK